MSNKKEDKEITFENYQYIVNVIVNIKNFIMPPCLEKDDLYQIGYTALSDIIKNHNPKNKKNKETFESYAFYLVYFRILDELRKITKIRRHKGKEGYNPMRTGMYSESSYFTETIQIDGESKEMITLLADEAAKDPLDEVQELLDIPLIKEEVYNNLDKRERIILKLYAECNKTLKEIGMLLGICESRTSQIYTKIKQKAHHILQEEGY